MNFAASRRLGVLCTLVSFTFLGCDSGGGSEAPGDGAVVDARLNGDGGVSADDAGESDGGTPIVATPLRGVVVIPDEVALAPGDLTAVTGFGEAPVADDGMFTVEAASPGESLVMIVDGDDNVVLVGFVDSAAPGVVDAHSTVAALAFYALHLYALPPTPRSALFELVRVHSSLEYLSTVLSYLMRDQPALLMTEDAELLAELENALQVMTVVEKEARPRGEDPDAPRFFKDNNAVITSEPSAPQSGVLVGPNLSGNGMQITNLSRRTAWYYVYKTGFESDDGQATTLAEPELVRDGFINPTNGLSGTVGTLTMALTGGLDFGPQVVRDPVPINVPEGQRKAFFEAIVAGSFIPFNSRTPAWFERGDPLHEAWQTRATLMTTISFVRDLVFPVVFSVVLPVKGAVQGADDFPTWSNLATLFVSQIPTLTGDLASGDWRPALKTTLLAMANNQELRNAVAFALIAIVGDPVRGAGEKAMDRFLSANLFVAAADIGVAATDIGLVLADLSDANALERWEVTAIRARVLIEASETTLDPGTLDSTLSCRVPGSGPTDHYCFKWTLQGPGELSEFLPGPDTGSVKTAVSSDPDVQYLIEDDDLVDGPLAVIACEAFTSAAGAACTFPPGGELVGEGRIAIEAREDEVEPCRGVFDYEVWQAEANGATLTVSGRYGERLTLNLYLPPDPDNPPNGYRDAVVYFPRLPAADRDALTFSGDVQRVTSVNSETIIERVNEDHTAGPVWLEGGALIQLSAQGAIQISAETEAWPADCDTDQPGSRPCCPYYGDRPDFGTVLVGPLAYLRSGVSKVVAPAEPN